MTVETPLATVAVSECLLGKRVRWDGDHNGDGWPRRAIQALFRLVGVCPEVGIGLGVPREPIRLVGPSTAPRAVAVADPSRDHTAALQRFARSKAPLLGTVHGYVFADRSPSCGLAGVKVFSPDDTFARAGRGVFAAAVLTAHPNLPAVDAGALNEPDALFRFVLAVARRAGKRNDSNLRQRAQAAIADARARHSARPGDATAEPVR